MGTFRLLLAREARAMARVSHPDVVAIHDVGEWGEQLFVAMEFVKGSTLRAWLAAERRPWPAILDAFVHAGRGLAAAHAVGRVHCDFKPDNVLVGDDGRVRVTDFGLARAAWELPSSVPVEGRVDAAASAGEAVEPRITRTGALVGTPAYMAPEQLEGRAADHRSDVFSFCVSLHEALFGVRPFAGSTVESLQASIRAGKVAPGRVAAAPGWLRRVVLRGLRALPRERPASMNELLAALAHDPRRRRRWLAGAVAAAAIGATVIGYQRSAATRLPICAGAEQKLVGVWDPPRTAEVERAFVATGRPGAPEVWKSLEQILDRYNAEWVAAHTEACAATRLRGEQSEVLLDLRMACLQQRLAAERELTTLFARADGALLGKSVQAASALEPVAGCADTRALTAGDHRPSDAAARERLDSIDASLAKIKALSLAGKYQEDLPIAEATVAAAKRESYAPLLAAAQYELGVLQFQLGDPKASEATLAEASTAGIAGGRDDLTARALAFRGWVLGAQLNQAEGLRSLDLARGAILHLGGSDELEGFRLTLDASARNALGQPEPAIVGLRAALLLREKVYGNDSFQVAEVLRDLGHALSAAGKQAEAIEVLGRSLVLCERLFGPAHPQVAGALIHRGSALVGLGQSAQALPDLERSLSIREGWYGPDSPLVVEAVMQLGGALTDLKRWREAEPLFQRALAVSEQIHDPYPDAVIALGALSEIHLELGQPALAVADAERAAAHPLGSQLAPEARAENDFELAKALWIVGADRPRARKLDESAQKTFETSPPGELVATREEIASWLASHEIGAAKMR